MIHELKTWEEYFKALWEGHKTFEVREDDRNFEVGDMLDLKEYDHIKDSFSGRYIRAEITYKLNGGSFGIEKGYCVLGLNDPVLFDSNMIGM